jgi:hypothetical protein
VVGDPADVGELLVGVGAGLGVCDGLGDRVGVGLGGARVGLDVGADDAGLPADWLEPAGAAVVTGRTRM